MSDPSFVIRALADVSLTLLALAGLAAAVTWRAAPAAAVAAHRVWLAVVGAAVPLLLLSLLGSPVFVLTLPTGIPWPASATAPQWAWARTACVVYGLISAVLLLRVAAGLVQVHRLVRASRPINDARVRALDVPHLVGTRRLQYRESHTLAVPVTVGVLRPVILMPRAARAWPDRTFEAILRHEQTHVARADYLWGVLAAVTEACLWFHPAVWFATRRLRWFSEVASDHAAASVIGADSYAAELLSLASGWVHEHRVRYAITVGAASSIARRIGLLLDDAPPGQRGTRGLTWAAVFVLIVAGCAAGIRVDAQANAGSGTAHDGHAAAHRARHQAHPFAH